MMKSEIPKPGTFLYFAYGGNLWSFRMHMNNPTAEFVSIARVDNYRLDFIRYSKLWGGPTATLVSTANAHVWGVIYRVSTEEQEHLDVQKALPFKKYYVKYLNVHTPYMGTFNCRAYIQKVNPLPRGDNDPIPVERWPSWTYRAVMVVGAKEHGLPEYYIKNLNKLFVQVEEEGTLRMEYLLNRYAKGIPCECRVPGRIPRQPLKFDLRKKRGEPYPTKKLKKKKSESEKIKPEPETAQQKAEKYVEMEKKLVLK